MLRFKAARWPTSLTLVSLLGTVALVAAGFAVSRAIPHGTRVPFAESFGALVACVPPAIGLGALLFVVRGYEVRPGELLVERLLWSTRVDLAGLSKVTLDPQAMKGSLRVWGNGGLFSVTGLYRNGTLGTYRAYVTDARHAVVLHLPSRPVVVSPEDTYGLVQQLRAVVPGLEVAGPSGRG